MEQQQLRQVIKSIAVPIARLNSNINRNLFTTRVIDPGRHRPGEPIRFGRHRVGDPDGLLERPAEPVTDAWGGRTPRFFNFEPAKIDEAVQDFDRIYTYSRGAPRAITLNDLIYHPLHKCLFAQDGRRVDESCLRRRGQATLEGPEQIAPIEGLRTLDQSLIYAGWLFRHFGHFLTEGIARYWYGVGDESRPMLSHPFWRWSPMSMYIDRFFAAIEFPHERLVTFLEPVRLREVTIPHPSITLGFGAFEAHRLIPEGVAAGVLGGTASRTSQPLYLSRRSVGRSKRRIVNEHLLEERLLARGYKVVQPEKLSLDDQIRLINEHETIVGTLGSAFHGILFDISPESHRNLVCFCDNSMIDLNYILMDAIKSYNTAYIGSLVTVPGPAPGKNAAEQDRVLDLDVTLGALKELGLL